jgi:hypothetical protein
VIFGQFRPAPGVKLHDIGSSRRQLGVCVFHLSWPIFVKNTVVPLSLASIEGLLCRRFPSGGLPRNPQWGLR